MRPFRFARWALLAVFPASLAWVTAADTPPPRPKELIERPVKNVVGNTAPTAAENGALMKALEKTITPKRKVETPVKDVVAKAAPAPAPAATPDNPTVEPGKVKWHATLEDAQAAAKKSGKPVLLFQMMGYLDKKFC